MKKLLIGAVLIAIAHANVASAARDGEAVFNQQCAPCHNGGNERAPRRDAFKAFEPELVLKALIDGPMAAQGRALNDAEMHAVAIFLTGKPFTAAGMPQDAYCADRTLSLDKAKSLSTWNGWGNDNANRRFQSAVMAGLKAADVPKLKLKWAFAVPGVIRVYGQPTIVGGIAFFGTASDKVYAIDAKTGCLHWEFGADSGVRTAITVAELGGKWMAFFGDLRGQIYAIDPANGKLIWKERVEDHPLAYITAAPNFYDSRLYVGVSSREETAITPDYACCTFRGSVVALDAATGKRIWKTFTIPDEPKPTVDDGTGRNKMIIGPAGGAVWGTPTVDPKARAIYVGTGNDYTGAEPKTTDALVAFDMDDGHVRWVHQMDRDDVEFSPCATPLEPQKCNHGPDYDFGSSPILSTLPDGKRILMAGQKSGVVHGVDPDHDGKTVWDMRIGKGGYEGGIEFGMATDGKLLYAPLSDFRFKIAMSGEAGARATIMGVPTTLDPTSGGGLFALDPATGKQVWHAPAADCHGAAGCSPAQTAAPTVIPGVVFSGSIDGHMRAYSTKDGHVLWDVDTKQTYQTVNGVTGNGGSIDGPGPVVVDGILYTNSGYGYVGEATGNVLLAFSVDGK
ncbi:MAG: cytochrome Cbb3 [Rhodospirillales bacterium]|nr:cytochrome Cbb3 [Rhodospirillales bacterium]